MLSAPVVQWPVSPCSRKLRVSNALTGATVRLYEDGREVGKGTADRPDAFIPLDPAVTLTPGRWITARQERDGDSSPATPKAAAALVAPVPTTAMLGQIFSRTPLLKCGTCLWLEGIVPGATVRLQQGNDPPITVVSDWAAVAINVSSLSPSEPLHVSQSACGLTGPPISLPAPLEWGNEQHKIDAPSIEVPLFPCQRALTLHPLPGSEITLDQSGQVDQFCFGSTTGIFWLGRELDRHDHLTVQQQFEHCEVRSDPAEYRVDDGPPPGPGFPYPVCAGDAQVDLAGVITGAHIQFFLDNQAAPFHVCDAGEPPHSFNLPPLGNSTRLGVRQALCANGPWSETTFIQLTATGSPDQPWIVAPVYEGAAAVGVQGLSDGTRVRVMSRQTGWSLGPHGIGNGDETVDVMLQIPPVAGDDLYLETVQCGEFSEINHRQAHVLPVPERLPTPVLGELVDDCGGLILIKNLVPGAMVDVEQVDDPAFPPSLIGTILNSAPVTREVSGVPVPPLEPGWFIRVRQRIKHLVSEPSAVARVGTGDEPLQFVPDSTARICQLTGDSDPGGRPHPFNTDQIALYGTDLGIPVEHRGRLYLFFGDCKGGRHSSADGDPIAWTASSPEPDGPKLHWLLNEEGYFRRLIIEGQSPLGNFEVPTGGFGYSGRQYLFIARDNINGKMQTSYLTVSKEPNNDPNENMLGLYKVASTLDDGANAPAVKWLIHVSPTVVRNVDWPGLPASTGDGLLLFGTSLYQESNVYLAWAPLTPGEPPPHPSTWRYYKADAPGRWAAGPTIPAGQEPTKLLDVPDPGPVAELSVTWQPRLRRWTMTHVQPAPQTLQAVVRTAKFPWGPWSDPVVIFDGVNASMHADAGNLQPGKQFVHLPRADESRGGETVPYAPYVVPRWTRFDRSTQTITLFYTLSVEDPPYNPQLMRSQLRCG